MKSIHWMKATSVLVAAALLAGCEKDNTPQPLPLTKYAFTAHPEILWKASPTAGSGDGTVLGLFIDGNQLLSVGKNGVVALLDKNTGETLWKTSLREEISARGVLSGNRVFVPTRQGNLIALDRQTGKILWSQSLSSLALSGVAVASNVVVVQENNGNVTGLDATSGEVLWTYSGDAPDLMLQGASEPVLNDQNAYVGNAKGQMFDFDLKTGAVKWSHPIAIADGENVISRMIDIDSTPLLVSGTLYAVAYHGNLVSMSAYSGGVYWEKPLSVYENIAMDGEQTGLFLTDESGVVFKVEASGGVVLWKQPALEHRVVSAPVVVGEHVLVGDYEGYVHVLSEEEGDLEGRLRLDRSPLIGQAVLSDKTSYWIAKSGEIIAMKLR